MTDPFLFLATVLAILVTPGPTNALLAASGATKGLTGSLLLIPAEICGYLISISVIGALVGPAITAMPLLGTVLRLVVGSYLALLAVRLWRHHAGHAGGKAGAIRPRQIFLTTLLNPKAILFALSILPFGSPHIGFYLAGFSVLVGIVGLLWILLGAGLGRAATSAGHVSAIPRIGAAAIGVCAVLIFISPLLGRH